MYALYENFEHIFCKGTNTMVDMEKLYSLIDDNEVVQVTHDLVSINSITHHEGSKMVEYYKRWFKDLGIAIRTYFVDDERANFFADYSETGEQGAFMFNGHQDVKPVDGMNIDPFSPVIRDGKMYGRGTSDMKGGIAAILCAFKAMVRAGITPKQGITFLSDLEEESGAHAGFKFMDKKGLLNGYKGMVSGEPTELTLQIGDRGQFTTAFEIKGIAAHSGLADKGVNAILDAAKFMIEYMKLPYLKVTNPYYGTSTANFENIEGGLYPSSVPDQCIVCLDSRIIPDTPPEMLKDQIEELIERMNKSGINAHEIVPPTSWRPAPTRTPAGFLPPDHEFVQLAESAIEHGYGKKPFIGVSPGKTYASFMMSLGVPAVIIGPGSIEQAHTADEWVDVEQLPEAARIYLAIMAEM